MMRVYREFHGNIHLSRIDFELRRVVRENKKPFKILTGYGSKTGSSSSKDYVIRGLNKLKNEKLIKGFIPGDVTKTILYPEDDHYLDKLNYLHLIKNDKDYSNSGIIFVII